MSQPEPFHFMDCGKVLQQYGMQKLNDTANDAHEKNMCIDWRNVFAGWWDRFNPNGDLPAYDCLKWSPRASLHSKDEDDWSHNARDFEINLPFKDYRTEKSRLRNTKGFQAYLSAFSCYPFYYESGLNFSFLTTTVCCFKFKTLFALTKLGLLMTHTCTSAYSIGNFFSPIAFLHPECLNFIQGDLKLVEVLKINCQRRMEFYAFFSQFNNCERNGT